MSELVLITGTSSGIGLSAAIECAARGHRVVATMRNIEKRKALDEAAKARGVTVYVERLDVIGEDAPAKIKELVLKYGPVFALVNNAGIAIGGAFEEQTDADAREQFETNVFGLMSVTRAALPSMRASGRGRIINVSSISGRIALPLSSIYAATKHAVEGFSESLRWELEPFGIEVCLVEPGTFKTGIQGENLKLGGGVSKTGPYAAINETVEKMFRDDADRAPPPDAVGQCIARLVSASSPPFRSVVGTEARVAATLRRALPDRLFATGIRKIMRLPKPR